MATKRSDLIDSETAAFIERLVVWKKSKNGWLKKNRILVLEGFAVPQ